MIIIPKEHPVAQNLNSFYINIYKFFEHYQGELGSGGIHFQSPFSEGVIFFDEDDLLNGIFQDKEKTIKSHEGIERIIDEVSKNSYLVNVYEIGLDTIYLWANLPNAETIHNDLSSEFTDLDGLIKKMNSEKLNGYIEILLKGGKAAGLLIFNNGDIIGSSMPGKKIELKDFQATQNLLIKKSREVGGAFKVKKISLAKASSKKFLEKSKPKPMQTQKDVFIQKPKQKIQEVPISASDIVAQLLIIFEKSANDSKRMKSDFDTILKKKFMEKVDDYDFLDPFSAEFQYSNGKVKAAKSIDNKKLIKGVLECVREIADDLKITKKLDEDLVPWKKKYANEIMRLGIKG